MTPFAALLGLTLTLTQDTSRHALAESLLARGREWFAHPVYGRFHADSLFRRAAELEPWNPEPLYYLGKVGLYLGGDDGEMIARPALVRMIGLSPDYRDGWTMWRRLYRGRRERREAARALALHTGLYIADLRRAGLLIELHLQDSASALLRDLARRAPADPAPLALLAESRFEAGDDSAGMRAYADAINLADNDTSGILWAQVRSIATPSERQRFAALKPGQHAAFFRSFWSYRDPNLRTVLNERMGEHFRRYAEAQDDFALLHPNARYHHSAAWRALAGGLGMLPGPDIGALVEDATAAMCGARLPSVRDTTVRAGLGRDVLVPDSDESANLEDGLDDRGRVWVRYGKPDLRFTYGADGETWCYDTGEGMLRVTFIRRTGGWGASGDLVVTPVIAGEAESAWRLLTTDRPTVPLGRLTFSFWPVTFRIEAARRSELVLFPDSVGAVAELVNDAGDVVARDTATNGPLHLAAPPGTYLLLMDGSRGRNTGRYRGSVNLPSYPAGIMTISGVLIAGGGAGSTRDSMEAAARGSLLFRAAEPLRVYAEVYGLEPTGGAVNYEATYRFERLGSRFLFFGGSRVTTVTFHRIVPPAESHVETLRFDPGRLPRGRYRLLLQVRDPLRGTAVATSSVQFELR